jgi:hypothetical protein
MGRATYSSGVTYPKLLCGPTLLQSMRRASMISRVAQTREAVLIQTFVAKLSVEALDVPMLLKFRDCGYLVVARKTGLVVNVLFTNLGPACIFRHQRRLT